MKFKIKGIDEISKVLETKSTKIVNFDKDGGITSKGEYIIYTSGINLVKIRYIKGIDIYRTRCNSIFDIYENFGIEAARASILRESFGFWGKLAELNHQHLSILADTMTHSGAVTSIDRNGMGKSNTSPLTRASFEKVIDQLLEASIYGEKDMLSGVSPCIMLGKVFKGGTGYCDVVLDTELLENSEHVDKVDIEDYPELENNATLDDREITHGFMPS